MTVAKIVELSSESTESFENAIQHGISRASRTIKGIKSAWVAEQKVLVKDGQVSAYRVVMRVSFVLE
jgi:dodecin